MEILNIIYNYPFLLLGATFVALAFLFKKFRSSNYEPQIFSSSQAVLFRLPETSLQQKILELFEVKRVAEELQVEVFPLGRESTKPQSITKIKRVRRGEIITLDEKQAYGYRFRTRESYRLFPSPWSEEKALVIKGTPFSSPKTITEEMVNQLRSGILNIQRPYRGCIVGARGVGKSSLIISIMNLLRVEAAHPIALDANESVTTESKEHSLVDGKLAFIDTPGTVSNCNFSIFKNIFNGECRKVTDRGMIDGTYENFENDEKKKIDFVLFAVRAPNIKEGKREEDDDDKSINSQLFEQIKASSK